jgi:hypothetical protein
MIGMAAAAEPCTVAQHQNIGRPGVIEATKANSKKGSNVGKEANIAGKLR